MRGMLSTKTTIPIHFSPVQHARLWFVLAVVLFSLAGGAHYWHEVAQYDIYLSMGLVFSVLGLLPLLAHWFARKGG